MMNVEDARIDVFKPGNASDNPADADTQIPVADIDQVEVSNRARDLVDRGELRIRNEGFNYTGAVTSGDRVEFRIEREDDAGLRRRWTGLVRNVTHEMTGPNKATLAAEVDDYVFGILDMRTVTDAYVGRRIAGTQDSILELILDEKAPELTIDSANISTEAAPTWNGTDLIDACSELAEQADAVLYGEDRTLSFKPIDARPVLWAIDENDRGLPTVRVVDDHLSNELRVNGGTALDDDATQTNQSAWTTVTNSSRLTTQITMRKSRIARFHLYTDPRRTGSGDDLSVRVQADDGGAPKAPNSRESDVSRRTLGAEFLAEDGYTAFIMPEHVLPERQVWILLESGGSTGQDIGVDSNNVPAYRAEYPYPLDTVLTADSSIDEYRRRERTLRNESLDSRNRAETYGAAILRRTDEPARTVEFPAESTRAHDLGTGDVIGVPLPKIDMNDNAIVTEVRDTYDGIHVETDVTAHEVDSL